MASKEVLFEELYVEFRPMVLQLCRGYVKGDAAAAEDLAQEVFVQVWRALPRFRGEASAKTWIYRITVNACLQEIRTRSRRPQTVPDAEPPEVSSDSLPSEHPRLQSLYRAIGTLPELDRLVYMLLLDGEDYATIAEVTGVTLGALRVRVHRVHSKLKILLHHA